jgi:PAS domain S-box-containing protein
MALVDLAGCLLQVNEALCRITGYASEALQATTLAEITHPDDVELDAEDMGQLLAGEITSYQVEKRYRHGWGHYTWVLLTVSLVRNDHDAPLYLISQVQDISARKELEAHLVPRRPRFPHRPRQPAALRAGATAARRPGRTVRPHRRIAPDRPRQLQGRQRQLRPQGGRRSPQGDRGLASAACDGPICCAAGRRRVRLAASEGRCAEAATVANEFVKTLDRHSAALGEDSIHISASIGVVLFDGLSDLRCSPTPISRCTRPRSGRNQYSLYQPGGGHREPASTRFVEAERIRRALDEDRFFLDCQPILDLSSDDVRR